MFDTIAYLEERGITYRTEGKNVSAGWIGIPCPFCGDQSFHLGIKEYGFSCWRCGEKGNISKLIMEIDSCNYYQANVTIDNFKSNTDLSELKQDIRKRLGDKILPVEASKSFPDIHLAYLQARNFNLDLIETYDLYACYNLGNYKFRIIVPVKENNQVVSFTALAVAKQQPKYLHCKNELGIISIKQCLYNIDTVRDIAVICEGVTDVWRMGSGAVATFGLEYTSEQIQLLVRKGVRKAHVMFDSEDFAIKKARKLANALSLFMESETIELETGDPGELTDQQVAEIREDIFNG